MSDGRMVKGKKFINYREVGNPVSAARIYNAQNADELVFLGVDNLKSVHSHLIPIIEKVSKECFMPLTVGGGVKSLEDIRALLNAGADKVVISTAAIREPDFIKKASLRFGKQCISVCIDIKKTDDGYSVIHSSGRFKTDWKLFELLEILETNGAGEFIINSIDNDGGMQGYDLKLIKQVVKNTSIPIITLGGAGNFQHLVDAIEQTNCHAVACASIFHFGDNNPIRARSYLKNSGIPVKHIK